ncbi:type II toxin-antitoxin system RelE/ParE family toxin [Methanocalculus sp.]|uniref:type II toxin-antitoxin system RelE family toxin n=1 Tax=Methanocalculus sp. TaxID=2004547 RepID=UPI00262562A2|nr:type II toxin-antitoxin system RelE/ParE family toxin [Methanocalculus sp.]MDG6251444.1 type II toxin-antitoxin system RelE/ParE family toxin [Methanocalculus sp.]
MAYKVLISAVAKKDLIWLPVPVGKAICRELSTLAGETNPKIHVKKLKGSSEPSFYSLRVGDYRVILTITNAVMIIHVIETGNRSPVYCQY